MNEFQKSRKILTHDWPTLTSKNLIRNKQKPRALVYAVDQQMKWQKKFFVSKYTGFLELAYQTFIFVVVVVLHCRRFA